MRTKTYMSIATMFAATTLMGRMASAAEAPYNGTPAAIPGTAMAENYDTGGQGVAYNVTSTNGSDNSYRSDGIDLEAASSPATGNDIGWTAAGQWFRYTVNVATAGTYQVTFLVAAESVVSDAFHLSNSAGSNLSGSVAVPNTGNWQTWAAVTANVTLPAGTQTLTLNQDAGGWNIDSIVFASKSGGEAPYGGTPAAIPGAVMAENYDIGGQSVAYNVTSTNGSANSYRSDGVDLEVASSPATGNDVGWTAAGQWFNYTVSVSTAGTYTVSFLVASESAVSDAFHLSNSSGANLSGSVAVPDTGGWQTWTTVTATVTLPAGAQTLTLNQDAGGWNIDNMAFSSGTVTTGLSMLHASGRNIVNANGEVVQLKGVNLGGWLVWEPWMTPADSGGLPDMYSIISELDSRFGVAEEQALVNDYENSWITAQDIANIKSAGLNLIRIPVWWGNFYPIANVSNSGWRSDAFTQLDRVVNLAAAAGLYVVIDMHGVVGGQSTSDDTGEQNQNQYWTNSSDQGNTAWMWWEIANHYNGNPAVMGYDLLNEPMNAPSTSAVISAYASLYNTVRSADPNHMIIMEGTFGSWDWSMLPSPSSEGWTNVVYEMHEYQWNPTSESQVTNGSTNQVNDFNNHASYNCPGYVGEFNDMYDDAAVWESSESTYNNGNLAWTMWSYKSTNALSPANWGWYGPTYWAATPNVSTDSAATIAADWEQWTTTATFALNPNLGL